MPTVESSVSTLVFLDLTENDLLVLGGPLGMSGWHDRTIQLKAEAPMIRTCVLVSLRTQNTRRQAHDHRLDRFWCFQT